MSENVEKVKKEINRAIKNASELFEVKKTIMKCIDREGGSIITITNQSCAICGFFCDNLHHSDSFYNTPDNEITKLYVVEYSGFFNIQDKPEYGGINILDADEVGYEKAKKIANDLVNAYNEKLEQGEMD
jgi:hypothetical protein